MEAIQALQLQTDAKHRRITSQVIQRNTGCSRHQILFLRQRDVGPWFPVLFVFSCIVSNWIFCSFSSENRALRIESFFNVKMLTEMNIRQKVNHYHCSDEPGCQKKLVRKKS